MSDHDRDGTAGGQPRAERTRNTGYDEWLDAIERGEGYYLESPEGHGSLPPRRVCPQSGSTDLTEKPLPDVGTIETYTVSHVAGPEFAAETPYVTAIAEFGSVRLTGLLRGVDPDDTIDLGQEVTVGVETRVDGEERVVVFRPV